MRWLPVKIGKNEVDFIMQTGLSGKVSLTELTAYMGKKDVKFWFKIFKKLESCGLVKSKKKGRIRTIELTKQGNYYLEFYEKIK